MLLYVDSHEDYIANTAVLWSKDSAPGGQIAAGSASVPVLAELSSSRSPPSFVSWYSGKNCL